MPITFALVDTITSLNVEVPVKFGLIIFAFRANAACCNVEIGLSASLVLLTFIILLKDLYISTVAPVIIDPAIDE